MIMGLAFIALVILLVTTSSVIMPMTHTLDFPRYLSKVFWHKKKEIHRLVFPVSRKIYLINSLYQSVESVKRRCYVAYYSRFVSYRIKSFERAFSQLDNEVKEVHI